MNSLSKKKTITNKTNFFVAFYVIKAF